MNMPKRKTKSHFQRCVCFQHPLTIKEMLSLLQKLDYSLQNSGAKYVSNKMPKQFQNFSVCLYNISAKKPAEDSTENFAYYISNGFSICQHFAYGYDFVF